MIVPRCKRIQAKCINTFKSLTQAPIIAIVVLLTKNHNEKTQAGSKQTFRFETKG